jgi:hypothetical protein
MFSFGESETYRFNSHCVRNEPINGLASDTDKPSASAFDASSNPSSADGPSFTQVHVKTNDVPRVLPIRDGHEIKRRFMTTLASR